MIESRSTTRFTDLPDEVRENILIQASVSHIKETVYPNLMPSIIKAANKRRENITNDLMKDWWDHHTNAMCVRELSATFFTDPDLEPYDKVMWYKVLKEKMWVIIVSIVEQIQCFPEDWTFLRWYEIEFFMTFGQYPIKRIYMVFSQSWRWKKENGENLEQWQEKSFDKIVSGVDIQDGLVEHEYVL
jgi:hypothetical protein